MAELDKTTFEGKYNNSTSGLFKDNSTHEIGADDGRSLVTDVKDSFVNWPDDVLDEDNMASDSAVHLATQQSIKKYVDDQVGGAGTSIPYGTTAGTNNFTVAATPAVTAYADGDLFLIEMGATSTGAVTLNFDSVGARKAYNIPENQVGSGDWEIGRYYLLTYESTLDGGVGGFLQVNESVHGRVFMLGSFDASSGAVPSAIGSGPSGAIKQGDAFRVGTGGTVGGVVLTAGDFIIAQSDAPIAISSYTVLYGHTAFALKAPLASPALTGNPTAPTQAASDNSTKIATTAYVDAALGTVNATASAKGVVEIATLAEVIAGTDTGSTGASLSVLPSHLGGTRTTDGTSGNASVQTDHLGYIMCNSATPFNFTLDTLLEKTKITVINYGTGAVTFVAGSGMTVNGDVTLPGASGVNYPGVFINYDTNTVARIITGAAGVDVIGVHDEWVGAERMMPKNTAGCSALTQHEFATSNLNVKVLDFDQTTEEGAQFTIVMPRKWNLGGFSFRVYWTATAGTPGQTVQWLLNGYAYSNDDALTTAFGSSDSTSDTLLALNDLHITDVQTGPTPGGTPASADFVAIQIRRDVANDNLAADARLLGVSIRYTATAAVDE